MQKGLVVEKIVMKPGFPFDFTRPSLCGHGGTGGGTVTDEVDADIKAI